MKKHFKLLALIYLAAVALLLLIEFSQFKKVDGLRTQIAEGYQLISGRDEGLRLELEFRRLSAKLSAYVHQNDRPVASQSDQPLESIKVGHQEVITWFDIFWSRVFSMRITDSEMPEAATSDLKNFIVNLKKSLHEVDPLIQKLTPGDLEAYEAIQQRLDNFDGSLARVATHIAQDRQDRASLLQEKLNGALKSLDALLLTSAAGGGLILALLGAEVYRSRRQEQKTKAREAQVRFLAEHDSLTGLGNRAYLNEKMAQFIREADENGERFYFLLLDLDKFKDVNDTFGHPMGDLLLKQAAGRLVGIVADTDAVVARLGGDEFAILIKLDWPIVKYAAERIIASLSSSFQLNDNEICISTSVGISCYPELSSSLDELLRDADLALYAAKNRGRRTYTLYEPEMSVALYHRMKLETDLRHALSHDNGGLEVYYQPQVMLDDTSDQRMITGVEALVRWFHPEQGQIPTMEFIEIAEASGIIDELSDWIVRQACQDVVAWHKAGFMLNLSVNLSPLQLNNPDLPKELLTHLDRCGFDPQYLTLEITESADVTDTVAAAKMLSKFADKGISLAMDDFGTGYSNLGYLNSLPLNTLKIDRSFVMQITDNEAERKLVRGIINLAQGMGLKIVAEGVETEEQAEFLRSQNCEYGQGYLFGRPMHKLGMLKILNQQYEKLHPAIVLLEA